MTDRRLVRAVVASLGSSGAIQLVNVLTGTVLARALAPTGRGELAALLLWPGVVATLGLVGMADSVGFHVARAARERGSLLGSTLLIWLVQSVALSAVAAGLVPLVYGRYGHQAVLLGFVALVYIPVWLLELYATNALNAAGRTVAFQVLRLLAVANTALFLLVLVALHDVHVAGALAAFLAGHVAVALAALVLLARLPHGPLRAELATARGLLRFGLRSHLHTISTFLNERLDVIAISLLLAPAKLGLYVVAATLTSATALVGSSIATVTMPLLAPRDDADDRRATARRLVGVAVLASVAVTVPLVAFTPQVIELFFGRAFLPATDVCRVLLAAGLLLSVSRTLASVLTALGRPLDAGTSEARGLLVTAAALAVLLPTAGLIGAAVASVIAYAATLAWMARRALQALGLAAPRLPVAVGGNA